MFSQQKLLVSQRLLSQIPSAEPFAHGHKQTVNDVGDQDSKDQLRLERWVKTAYLLEEAEHTDIQHQEVPVHALQECVAEAVPLVPVHDREVAIVTGSASEWRQVHKSGECSTLLYEAVRFSTHLLDVVDHQPVHDLAAHVDLFHVQVLRDRGSRAESLLDGVVVLSVRGLGLVDDERHVLDILRLVVVNQLLRNENLVGLKVWILIGDPSHLGFTGFFEVKVVAQLLLGDLSLAEGRATVDVVAVQALIEHQQRHVTERTEVHKLSCSKWCTKLEGVLDQVLDDADAIDDQCRNEKH